MSIASKIHLPPKKQTCTFQPVKKKKLLIKKPPKKAALDDYYLNSTGYNHPTLPGCLVDF